MTWTVETLNETVDDEVEALPDDMKARLVWISTLIEEHGLPNVGKPYVRHNRRQAMGNTHQGKGWYITRSLCDGTP